MTNVRGYRGEDLIWSHVGDWNIGGHYKRKFSGTQGQELDCEREAKKRVRPQGESLPFPTCAHVHAFNHLLLSQPSTEWLYLSLIPFLCLPPTIQLPCHAFSIDSTTFTSREFIELKPRGFLFYNQAWHYETLMTQSNGGYQTDGPV